MKTTPEMERDGAYTDDIPSFPKASTSLIEDRGLQYNFTKSLSKEEAKNMDKGEARQLAAAKLYWRNVIRRNPLKGFVPNYKAELCIKDDAEKILYMGGNGVMKTTCMVNIIGNFCYGVQNTWFDTERFKVMHRPNRGRIVGTAANCKGAIMEELHKWFPKGRYRTKREHKTFEQIWVTDTECFFDVFTYEQDVREFSGVTLDFICFDEPPPENIWNECVQRMRQGGYIYIFMTPLNYAGWFFQMMERDGVDFSYNEVLKINPRTPYVRR